MDNISEIMAIDADNLKKKQKEALTDFAKKRLWSIIDCLDKGDYVEIDQYLFESPAGDGYGIDSTCISFNYTASEDNYDYDIGTLINKLKELAQ